MSNFNFNKVILGGRLTADPELKSTPGGLYVTTFTVAVNRRGKDQPTDFINVTAWRQTAEFVARYFSKGKEIGVQGSVQTRNYEDKSGHKRKAVEIVADKVSFVGGKSNGETQKTSYSAPQSRNGTHITAEQFEAVYSMEEDDSGLPF